MTARVDILYNSVLWGATSIQARLTSYDPGEMQNLYWVQDFWGNFVYSVSRRPVKMYSARVV
jgi:hypothetical protein